MRWVERAFNEWRQGWVGYAVAFGSVAVVNLIIWLVLGRTRLSNVSMLYLVAVLLTAVGWGRGPAVAAALAAFVTFDFLFTVPYYTLRVSDPDEWLALLLFLITAMITGQLAAALRGRAREAGQREREAVILYDLSRLLGEPELDQALDAVAERVRLELQLAAVAIEVPVGSDHAVKMALAGKTELLQSLEPLRWAHVLGEGAPPSASTRGSTGRWIRLVPPRVPGGQRRIASDRMYMVPIKAGGERVGTILLVRESQGRHFDRADDRLLSVAAAQIGLALERARLRQEATESELLRRTDELKTALLRAVSHDLRTPLASIMASAGSLRQEDVEWSRSERREFAETIEHEAERLNRIIGNLLDLSRMETGSLQPKKGWYDVASLVDDVVGRLRTTCAEHVVKVEVEPDLPPVPLDYIEIDQVLSNLLENAVKYTPPGTQIEVGAHRQDGEVVIEVADNGPGIPRASLPRLFDPFYRAEQRGQQVAGTGLGLAVARGIIEAHGGRIWAENRRAGGARFTFALPLMDGVTEMPRPETAGLP
jgi:two-component system sensor histidine kinase KdpD